MHIPFKHVRDGSQHISWHKMWGSLSTSRCLETDLSAASRCSLDLLLTQNDQPEVTLELCSPRQFLPRSLHLLNAAPGQDREGTRVRWLYWSFLSDSHGAHVSLSTPRECVQCSVSHIEGFSGLMGGWSPAHQVPGWLLCGPLLLLRGPSTPPSPSCSAHFVSVPRCHPTVSPSTQPLKKGVGE